MLLNTMKTYAPLLLFAFLPAFLSAQTQPAETAPPADFTAQPDKNGAMRFTPKCPPLPEPIAGAPKPFYTYYWEFGDGDFSFDQNPVHAYKEGAAYPAYLMATAHYDDNKKPPGYAGKQVLADAGKQDGQTLSDVFAEKYTALGMKTNRQPRAEEEIALIISYRNNTKTATDGRLHLFFNEKKFPARHFNFQNARTHFGELNEAILSQADLPRIPDWSNLGAELSLAGDGVGPLVFVPAPAPAEDLLKKARENYRDAQSWRFTQLQPGEKRNLFVTFLSTADMLKDTSAFIHLKGILEPFEPSAPAEEFTLEIEIVGSHDPNLIAVSDNRVNYRHVGAEKLDYKVQFQNNGEGPAKKVELTISLPEGLNGRKMRPLSWYPKCPVCPKTPAPNPVSCLDTATTQTSLVFTFRNIYLPGSRQEGVSDFDSTKGFVRYRIEADRDMPKLPFRSQARIVFDKNKPIYTNFSKTRFKIGLSPGLKTGYAFRPDSSGQGYFFMGGSLSPYKSWRIYPQVELLTGLKGRTVLPELVTADTIHDVMPSDVNYTDTLRQTTLSGTRGFVSLELPVLLRKNFSRFFGLGIGASARISFENGEDRLDQRDYLLLYRYDPALEKITFFKQIPAEAPPVSKVVPYSNTQTHFAFFADMTLGSVRAGPNLGLRAGGFLQRGFHPFVQASFEVKL